MQFFTFSVCRQCRQTLSRQFHISLPALRSGKSKSSSRRSTARVRDAGNAALLPAFRPGNRSPPLTSERVGSKGFSPSGTQAPVAAPDPETVRKLLLRHVSSWKSSGQTIARLISIGLEQMEAEALLNEYLPYIIEEIKSEHLTGEDPWSIGHLVDQNNLSDRTITDRVLTMRLFAFVAAQDLKIKGVSARSIRVLHKANEAFDFRYPQETFYLARRLRRKVYLHVGPTNSGKTYNALRALAAARSGVYAGPLRLLAHEVWERLNRGSIRPHGTDPAEAHRYARKCNLVTGEEQRIVSRTAGMTSCTVEMVNLSSKYDVCVIDEIQMIADPHRGHAWTTALLGVSADELHLCGEESAVPLITELIRGTGDDLEVKRYQRLTPLAVATKSLEGGWDQVQKGDCVVTFSRTSIFSLKRVVEEATGLRCAVAYGRLPPETRSEQAALFNAPDTGYDVMVASDAIGMGLNLKIKRIVFVQLTKFDGVREVPLSLSQIKQIGGRAGRFGEHGDSSSVGIVTCLRPQDLPILTKAFKKEAPILRKAFLPLDGAILARVAQLLPPSFSLRTMYSLMTVAGRIGANYSMPTLGLKLVGMDIIDELGGDLQLAEKVKFVTAPVSLRPGTELDIFLKYLRQFIKGECVDIRKSLQGSGLLDTLQRVDDARLDHEGKSTKVLGTAAGYDVQTQTTLSLLETLHKVLVTYSWLSFRFPISFSQRESTAKLREDTEKGIEFVLEGIANVKGRQKRQAKSLRQLRMETVDTRIKYELKNGLRMSKVLEEAATA